MTEETNSGAAMPTLEDWQHWTLVMGRAQQMLMEFWAEQVKQGKAMPAWSPPAFGFGDQGAHGRPEWRRRAGVPAERVRSQDVKLPIRCSHAHHHAP